MPLDLDPATKASQKPLYAIGEMPPLGHVPDQMYAWTIRRERHGEPEKAFEVEIVACPKPDSHEVLVMVMAAGVNYNGVWAGLGVPISPFDVHGADFHIAGSDASGIVWAVGDKVKRWKAGDEVVIHCNQDDGDDEHCNGGDPMFSPSQRIWGYETPDGSFAQFTCVQSQQLMPRPQHLTWEESACYTLTLATAYRMLFGHEPHDLKPGQNVLVWGASGGLGSYAIQLINTAGANAIGVISDESKRDFVMGLGAKGVLNRKDFNCWGQLPTVNTPEYGTWFKEALIYGDEEVEELDDEYEGAGNYGILKLKREINKESKNVLLKTENYAFASTRCGNTALEYPKQYSWSKVSKRRKDTMSFYLPPTSSPTHPQPIRSRTKSPELLRNKLVRRRRTTSESEELNDRKNMRNR